MEIELTDNQKLLHYMHNKKSIGIAYAYWFFLGIFGGHNFYLKRYEYAIAELLCFPLGCFVILPFILLAGCMIADLFSIPNAVREYNVQLMIKLDMNNIKI